jgi:probable HAF family extracellular repeat protein
MNHSYKKWSASLCAAVLGLFSLSTAHAQVLINLGDLGGGQSYAEGLNNSGQVVGYSTTSGGNTDAFLYSNGTITNLGTLAGDADSAATGINDSGQIVGYSGTSGATNNFNGENIEFTTGVDDSTAFLYSGGTMTNLATSVGGSSSAATGINNSGQVVGFAANSAGNTTAFLYSGGVVTNLGSLGGSINAAFGINRSGQVVGLSSVISNGSSSIGPYAFLYSGGTMTNLGTLNEPFLNGDSGANGINSSGQIVGYLGLPGVTNAALFSNGTITNLGTLGGPSPESTANGINDSGEIVGYSATHFGIGVVQAFVYSSGTGMENLNLTYASQLVSGTTLQAGFVSLEDATAINNSGQIAGYGTYWNGTTDQTEAFLLDPVAAPEPSTWAMMLGGLGLLAFWRWRTRRTHG